MSIVNEIDVPFKLRGVGGNLHVSISKNLDGKRWGDDLLAPLYGLPADAADGYPVMIAHVEHPFEGYAATMGSIQFIEDVAPDGTSTLVLDQGTNTPFATWGVKPVFFDSPFGQQNTNWTAYSYLCYTKDHCISKEVMPPLAAFTWGFEATEGKVTKIKMVRVVEREFRQAELDLVRKQLPDWTFPSS